ncbi:OmpA family protein [Mesoterricola silvestris]|nr:OmpA family protein [Mesoterricola silvestris]
MGFRATPAAPGASGQAVVRGEDGRMRVHAHFNGLEPATRFGAGYLTYVLWAISPQGRPVNLGEVVAVRGKAHLDAISPFPSFGLVLTAEPHFAVTRVSGAVVLENQPVRGMRPVLEAVETPYETGPATGPVPGAPGPRDPAAPPYVLQARNALRIAQAEGADAFAPVPYRAAAESLARMESEKRPAGKGAVLAARRAVLHAEDARICAQAQREALTLARERETAEELRASLEAARAQADSARAAADSEARGKEREITKAQREVRRQLVEQLNRLLQTRETETGLLATLTDVAFPSGSSRLSAPARVNLARVAGILLTRPGLRICVLGHTDATGRPALNARLSLQRAMAVRNFLAEQGLPQDSLQSQGLASSRPVASNATAEGRTRNRRVELAVSGSPIGM